MTDSVDDSSRPGSPSKRDNHASRISRNESLSSDGNDGSPSNGYLFAAQDSTPQKKNSSMPALRSYEETVLGLRQKEHREVNENRDDASEDKSGDEDDIRGPQDSALAQQKMKHELKMREKLLEEERYRKDMELQKEAVSSVNALSASRIIVGVAKVKINMMRQRMKLYEESERMGTDDTLRARKLLTWVASLSFLKKFEDKMQEPEIMEAKMRNYLKNLPAPPPPPPMDEPPNDEDQELHYKYEAMIQRYEKQWTQEGKKVLGPEKFEEIRNRTRDGPASKEKLIIADKCLKEAQEVLNEVEYQELLRKAWRLRDDHAAPSDYDPVAFAREVDNSGSWGRKKKG